MTKTYLALYQSYFYDTDSEYVQLTKEEYETLLPHEHELRMGNMAKDKDVDNFVWNVLYDRARFDSDAVDDMDDDKIEVIEIAVC
jgi:hypothetical protein